MTGYLLKLGGVHMSHIWVVEMLISGKWSATVGVALNRVDARKKNGTGRRETPTINSD